MRSSSAVQEDFFTSGLRWLCQRSRHCLPNRPFRYLATKVHCLVPYFFTSSMTCGDKWMQDKSDGLRFYLCDHKIPLRISKHSHEDHLFILLFCPGAFDQVWIQNLQPPVLTLVLCASLPSNKTQFTKIDAVKGHSQCESRLEWRNNLLAKNWQCISSHSAQNSESESSDFHPKAEKENNWR